MRVCSFFSPPGVSRGIWVSNGVTLALFQFFNLMLDPLAPQCYLFFRMHLLNRGVLNMDNADKFMTLEGNKYIK